MPGPSWTPTPEAPRRRPGPLGGDERGAATTAVVVGAMALVSSWTGWGGLALGLVAVVAALVALGRVRAARARGRRRPLLGLALGLTAVLVAVVVESATLTGAITYLHSSQVRTLDECMRQAQNEKDQHVCKSQHLAEYRARYAGRLDP